MKMKKLCQGAVIFTALHAQSSAFAEPKAAKVKEPKDAIEKIEDSRMEPKPGFTDLLPDSVRRLVDKISHSGNQPIC
ncbi:MAG TPA: hypothetical protein VE954_32570 [Oligoflexus sp.]|uniref:hypothetical protein n=1 Tax=Oligoflexus sp. TaxID=1971216 RepID=UPI002D324A31|nr:hypothetical protein [Oligoflexus sp.]HYX37863.1 hypothetical protein [Oligoflexus sp.]